MFSLKAEPAAIKEVIKMDYFLPLDIRLELLRIERLKIKGSLAKRAQLFLLRILFSPTMYLMST